MRPARRLLLAALLVTLVACTPATRQPLRSSATPFAAIPSVVQTAIPSVVQPRTPAPVGSRASEASPGTVRVEIGDDLFTPAQITMTTGTIVTWVNLGQNPHTATAHDDSFASPTLLYGGTYSHTFTKRGRYVYTCLYHPNMFGELVVVE